MCVNWLWARQRHIKGWDEKLIKYKKLVKSKQQSDPTSEKMLNDNEERHT